MQRSFIFKPGRGSKMLEQLRDKENIAQGSNDNTSTDVAEATYPGTPSRHIQTHSRDDKIIQVLSPIDVCQPNFVAEDKQFLGPKTSNDDGQSNSSTDIIEDTPPLARSSRYITLQTIAPVNISDLDRIEEDQLIHLNPDDHYDFSGIIEGTPPLLTYPDPRNVISRTIVQDEIQQLTSVDINEVEPYNSIVSTHIITDVIENTGSSISLESSFSGQARAPIMKDNNKTVDLEDDFDISDDSAADPDWQNDEDQMENNSENYSDAEEPAKENPKIIKTARWHKRNEDSYNRNKQKVCRSQCLPYRNHRKKLLPAKAPKPGNCGCKLNCLQKFTEEERIEICRSYWGLNDYSRQKDFIIMNVSVNPPQRCLVNAMKKRTMSRFYFFKIKNSEEKIKVCEKFFKSTLCISNGPINKAFSKVGTSGHFEGEDKRGRHVPHNKTKQEDIDFVKEHIEAFPKMESHYCRKTSSKQYLDSNLTISKMHELYKEKCAQASKSSVSLSVYRKVFCTEYNLDFHKPKKDQCLLCHKYNSVKKQNAPDLVKWQQKYELHMSLKDQSREAKEFDKILANNDETFNSITLDLQKVLHIPNSDVSLLYYLRKLNVYNATIYEARAPNDGLCYLWTEIDGKKGSDEVGTALYLWIKRLPSTVKEVSIFTDTCGGQNRNQFLLCLQLFLVQTTHLEIIEHKYLESGHTHMEVDSMHSAIETQMRFMPLYSMIDLCNVVRLARSNRNTKKTTAFKKPYEPIVMNNTDILNLKDLRDNLMHNRSLGSDGEKVQWLKVKNFRLEKKRPNIVLYRYDFKSDYKELNVLNKETTETVTSVKSLRKRKNNIETIKEFDYNAYTLKKAYNKKLPITKAKKKDLLKMCREKIIPPELHQWYQNLPDKDGKDFTPEEEYSGEDEE